MSTLQRNIAESAVSTSAIGTKDGNLTLGTLSSLYPKLKSSMYSAKALSMEHTGLVHPFKGELTASMASSTTSQTEPSSDPSVVPANPSCDSLSLTPPDQKSVVANDAAGDGSKYLPVFPRILDYLVGQDDGYEPLYNLSRICKTLSPLALDKLWEILPNLEPLYRLLPLRKEGHHWVYTTEAPIAFNWSDFCRCADRVLAIELKRPQSPLAPVVLATLFRAHDMPLIPSLKSVALNDIHNFTTESLLPFLFFIPPQLSSLSLQQTYASPYCVSTSFTDFLVSLNVTPQQYTQNLTHLRIAMPISEKLWSQIPLLVNLRTLSAVVLDSQFSLSYIQQLEPLPHLHNLQLILAPTSRCWDHASKEPLHLTASGDGVQKHGFNQLCVLQIFGRQHAINPIIKLVGKCLPNTLRTIDLVYDATTRCESLSIPFLDFPQTLNHLYVSAKPYNASYPQGMFSKSGIASARLRPGMSCWFATTAISSNSWTSLASLQEVQSIVFNGIQITTTSSDFTPFLVATNSFQYLHTLCLPLAFSVDSPGLLALASFASKFPQVKTLAISLNLQERDASKIQLLVDDTKSRRVVHGLENLYITNSNVMTATDVCAAVTIGELINVLFPFLRKVGLFQDDYDEAVDPRCVGDVKAKPASVDWWGGVFKVIQVLQQIRAKTRVEVCVD